MENQSYLTGDSNPVIALYISPEARDQVSLHQLISGPSCKLYKAYCLASAQPLLDKGTVGVVFCERDLTRGTWRNVLEYVSRLPHPPCLIVTSRHADERLWAEALNSGAWDVLQTPFNRNEVVHTAKAAWEHWGNQKVTVRPMKVMVAARSQESAFRMAAGSSHEA